MREAAYGALLGVMGYRPRFALWVVSFVALCLAVGHLSPQRLQEILYKTTLVNGSIMVAYIADRTLLGRLFSFLDERFAKTATAVAIILAARIIARILAYGFTAVALAIGI